MMAFWSLRSPFPLCRMMAALLVIALLFAAPAHADEEIGTGTLLFQRDGVATEIPALRLGTDISVDVSGPMARFTVTQAFRNNSKHWMAGSYLYPLPDDGAVDSLKMVVGDRVIIGRIKPREEASEIYEQAKSEGKRAGLVEQYRPNMFRTHVANVGPGETVLVQIELQAPVARLGDVYSLRLPLVVGPRYFPQSMIEADVAGASRTLLRSLVAPLAAPAIADDLNPVSINIRLNPGFLTDNVRSPSHAISLEEGRGAARGIRLTDGTVPANRDFVLEWTAKGEAPQVGLFHQTVGGEDYLLATIVPPAGDPKVPVPPRELIFVIDNSGSMGGESIRAAKDSLLHALSTLRPQDSFNIIRFDDTMDMLFASAMPASARHLGTARSFTGALDANGGTEMLPALEAALRGAATDKLRQVIFLTDGAIGNEDAMLAQIADHRGDSRVFMVGIGSAPNSHLMRQMAETGRGSFTYIGDVDEVRARMGELLNRLTAPVMTDIKADVAGSDVDFSPMVLPDLYRGEPLLLFARGEAIKGKLTISGTIGGKMWSRTLDLAKAQPSNAVAKSWARRRIGEVESMRWTGALDHDSADRMVEALGMMHHLVTSRTSLVAVDETPARPAGQGLREEDLPLLLPDGWDFVTLFEGHGTSDAMADAAADAAEEMMLEQGSLNFSAPLRSGLLILLAGMFLLVSARRFGGCHVA
ncbi:marine proteobacterial sortase target protein [Sphingomicrobium flavum]|uniref:marine proteobacterial sortase target protein n=1 Tax=Sphingomicrobium flavum TaxID=1229164 RepID=UPI0021ADEBF2|nr:marine proteobacterial sortase target protein [Sphingomicrobium flavum]